MTTTRFSLKNILIKAVSLNTESSTAPFRSDRGDDSSSCLLSRRATIMTIGVDRCDLRR
jgi:hypothetical protein